MTMKLILHHHNTPSTYEVNSLLEERIPQVGDRVQIDEVRARLECHGELRHIVTPGPDLLS